MRHKKSRTKAVNYVNWFRTLKRRGESKNQGELGWTLLTPFETHSLFDMNSSLTSCVICPTSMVMLAPSVDESESSIVNSTIMLPALTWGEIVKDNVIMKWHKFYSALQVVE